MIAPWVGVAAVSVMCFVGMTSATAMSGPPYVPIVEWIDSGLESIGAVGADETGLVAARDIAMFGVGAVIAAERSPVDFTWSVETIPPPDPATWHLWGRAVARDGGRIVIGAPARLVSGIALGAVLILERGDDGWVAVQTIEGETSGGFFGFSLALAGETLLVGSPYESVNGLAFAGAIRVYRLQRGAWRLAQTLTSDEPHAGERFGHAVAIDGDRLVVGAIGSHRAGPDFSGAAWIFACDANEDSGLYSLETLLTSPHPAAGDALGASVSIADDTVAIGVPGANVGPSNATGAVLAATRGVDGWHTTLIASPFGGPSAFGQFVLASPSRFVASRPHTAPALAFVSDGTTWSPEYQCWLVGPLAWRGEDAVGLLPENPTTIGAAGLSRDCDGDGVQDQLAVAAGLVVDCDGDLVPDSCQIDADPSRDLDGDGRLDDCPLARAPVPLAHPSFPTSSNPYSHMAAAEDHALIQTISVSSGAVTAVTWPHLVEVLADPPELVAGPSPAWATTGTWCETPLVVQTGRGATWFAQTLVGSDAVKTLGMFRFEPDGTASQEASFPIAATAVPYGLNLASSESELLAAEPWDLNEVYPIRRFHRQVGGTWIEGAPTILADPESATGIGIARSGDLVALADLAAGDEQWAAGRVRIGSLSAKGEWLEEAVLRVPPSEGGPEVFGTPLRLEGDRLVVASRSDPAMKRLFIFRRVQPGAWALEGSFTITHSASLASRRSLALRGTQILVGAGFAGIERFRRAANGAWIAEAPIKSIVVGWQVGVGVTWLDDGRILTVARGASETSGEVWLLDPVADCNGNGVADRLEILAGTSTDANGNGIPDECERPGDMNMDGVVNAADLALLLGRWGLAGWGDLNDDGIVGADDLAILLADWT